MWGFLMGNFASHHWHSDPPIRRRPRPRTSVNEQGVRVYRHIPGPRELKRIERSAWRKEKLREILSEVIGGLIVTAAIALVIIHLLPLLKNG